MPPEPRASIRKRREPSVRALPARQPALALVLEFLQDRRRDGFGELTQHGGDHAVPSQPWNPAES